MNDDDVAAPPNGDAARAAHLAALVDALPADRQARLRRIAADSAQLYPNDLALYTAAVEAAADYLTGKTDLHAAGSALARARRNEQLWRARVRAMVVLELAYDDGMSERAVTKAANVDRMNIRKWLGKNIYRRDSQRS